MNAAIPTLVAAFVAIATSLIAARVSRRGQDATLENEQEKLSFEVWKAGQDELRHQIGDQRKQIEELRKEVTECHHARDNDRERWDQKEIEYEDELQGMRQGNQALRLRMSILEAHLESVTGRRIGELTDDGDVK